MATITRRQLLRGAVGAAAGLGATSLLGACGSSGPARSAGAPQAAGGNAAAVHPATPAPVTPVAAPAADLVRFAWWTDVGRPTPFQISVTGPGGAVLLTLLYDTLTWKDSHGVIPWLGASWEAAPDGAAYTFRIVDGATWHDGRPLTADDVAFSFDYYVKHPYAWMPTTIVDSTAVAVDGGAQIRLERPYAAFLEDIAGNVPIVPRHVWEPVADPTKYTGTDASTGSGPYALTAYDATQGAYRLLANDRYWRGKPLAREWRQVTVPSQSSLQAVQRGDADISLSADASVRDVLAGDGRLKVHETAPLSLTRLVVNTERAPLDRKEVRQAIAYALDRARIVRSFVIQNRAAPHVEAARAIGASGPRIVLLHLLPSTLDVLPTKLILIVRFAVFAETTLAFLGLGDPSRPSWGAMLSWAFNDPLLFARSGWPWLVLPPALAIAALILSTTWVAGLGRRPVHTSTHLRERAAAATQSVGAGRSRWAADAPGLRSIET